MDYYSKLEEYLLPEKVMDKMNFPRSTSEKGKAVLKNSNDKLYPGFPTKFLRICNLCKKKYRVAFNECQRSNEVCSFHPEKSIKKGQFYKCCGGSLNSPPCTNNPQHVHCHVDTDNLTGFICTNEWESKKNIIALDCEMLYTDLGFEIAAITVINEKCEVVLEKIVCPEGNIINYNTFHSSLSEKDFDGVTYKLEHLHNDMKKFIGKDTILVGHGLENDLLRLKVIHDKIFDTCFVYPHPRGLPYRKRLDELRSTYLKERNEDLNTNKLKCYKDAVDTVRLALHKIGFVV